MQPTVINSQLEGVLKGLELAAQAIDKLADDPYLDSHLAYSHAAEIIREIADGMKPSDSDQ